MKKRHYWILSESNFQIILGRSYTQREMAVIVYEHCEEINEKLTVNSPAANLARPLRGLAG